MSPFEIDDSSTLTEVWGSLYLSQKNCDVTFIVGGSKKIKAHKLVVATFSDVLGKIVLKSEIKENQMAVVSINAPVEAFELLLKYIYTAKLSLENMEDKFEVCCDLLDLSRWFNIPGLQVGMTSYFLSIINSRNVFEVLNVATQHKLEALKSECFKVLNSSGLKVLTSEKVTNLPLKTVQEILKSPPMTDVMAKFYFLQKWLTCGFPSCTDAEKQELIELIDVSKVSNHEILSILAPSKVFDDSYLLQVMKERNEHAVTDPFEILGGRPFLRDGKQLIRSIENYPISFPAVILKLHSMAKSFTFKASTNEEMFHLWIGRDDAHEILAFFGTMKAFPTGHIYSIFSPIPFKKIAFSKVQYVYDIEYSP